MLENRDSRQAVNLKGQQVAKKFILWAGQRREFRRTIVDRLEQGNPASQRDVSYPQGSLICFILFLFFVLYKYLQFGYRFSVLGALRVEFLLGALLTVLAVLSCLGRKQGAKSSLYVLVGLYFICLIGELPRSYDPETSWTVFVDRIVKFSILSLFIVAFVVSPSRLAWFLVVWMAAFLKLGQEGLVGTITGSLIWENQGIPRLHGPTPIYEHPNSFAGNFVGTLPFVVVFWPVVSLPLKMILLVQGVFAVNVILFTGSRTGYIALGVCVLFLIITSRSKKRSALWTIILASCLIPTIPKEYVGRINSIFTGKEKEGQSIETRKEILRDAWTIFQEHPLGVGVAAFPAVRMQRFGRDQDTHNLYLEVATNLGIQGFIVFSCLVWVMLRTLRSLRSDIDSQLSRVQDMLNKAKGRELKGVQAQIANLILLRTTCVAMFLFLIVRLTLGLFGMDLYEVYWWFALGLTLAINNMNKWTRNRTEEVLVAARI